MIVNGIRQSVFYGFALERPASHEVIGILLEKTFLQNHSYFEKMTFHLQYHDEKKHNLWEKPEKWQKFYSTVSFNQNFIERIKLLYRVVNVVLLLNISKSSGLKKNKT